MTKQIVEIKQITGVKSKDFDMLYTIKDGDKYLLADDGSVFFTDKVNIHKYMDNTLEVPYFENPAEFLEVFEIDGKMAVCDANMNAVSIPFTDIWQFIIWVGNEEFQKLDFPNFIFPEEKDYDDDYDGPDDDYDTGPSYYDPRYDGPFHYIPLGNHYFL